MTAEPAKTEQLTTVVGGIDYSEHPVYLRDYTMPTPAIAFAYQAVTDAIKKRDPGIIIYGDFRGGKTWFWNCAFNKLKDDFGDALMVHKLLAEHSGKRAPSESQHLSWMLGELEYVPTARDVRAQRKQLDDYLGQQAKKSKRRQIVFLIDEAQLFRLDQWGWLMDTYNRIELQGVAPTFVWIGDPAMKQVRNTVFSSREHQPAFHRFLVREVPLEGPGSVDEFKLWLQCFDVNTEYPPKSGISYTRFFFPTAFDCDWRLESIAGDLRANIDQMLSDRGLPPQERIRTKYFFRIVETLFLTCGNRHVMKPDMSAEVLQNVILESHYLEALRSGFAEEMDPR